MLTKTKNIRKKTLKKCFSKIQETSERMVQGKQQRTYERNQCIRFRDNCDCDKFRFDELKELKTSLPKIRGSGRYSANLRPEVV